MLFLLFLVRSCCFLLRRLFVGSPLVRLLCCVFLPAGVFPVPVGGLVFPAIFFFPLAVRGAVFAYFSTALLVLSLTLVALVLGVSLFALVRFPGGQGEGLRDSTFAKDVALDALVCIL